MFSFVINSFSAAVGLLAGLVLTVAAYEAPLIGRVAQVQREAARAERLALEIAQHNAASAMRVKEADARRKINAIAAKNHRLETEAAERQRQLEADLDDAFAELAAAKDVHFGNNAKPDNEASHAKAVTCPNPYRQRVPAGVLRALKNSRGQ